MTWLRHRKLESEAAARRLEEAEERVNQIVDRVARLVRLEAEAGVYTAIRKRKGLK